MKKAEYMHSLKTVRKPNYLALLENYSFRFTLPNKKSIDNLSSNIVYPQYFNSN